MKCVQFKRDATGTYRCVKILGHKGKHVYALYSATGTVTGQ